MTAMTSLGLSVITAVSQISVTGVLTRVENVEHLI